MHFLRPLFQVRIKEQKNKNRRNTKYNMKAAQFSKTKLLNLCCIFMMLQVSLPGFSQHKKSLDWLINTSSLEGKKAIGEHPRGLVTAEEVPAIRKRIKQKPFKGIFQEHQKETEALEKELASANNFEVYKVPNLAAKQSYMYLFTGNERWAEKAYQQMETIFKDTIIFNNPVSRGLTRANMLRQMAITYDFCYPAWNQKQRDEVNRQLYKIAYSVHANMGYDANYSLVSNWMGVRWSSALFACLVWDNPAPDEPSLATPLIWDGTKRLTDHLNEIMFSNGWNGESMGYHGYDWSFIGPALIAYQNHSNKPAPATLEQFSPQAINTMWGYSSIALAIETRKGSKGMKPDLSDDHLNIGGDVISLNLKLYPQEQIPALKWMHDYLEIKSLYSILYYPEEQEALNPENMDWLTYSDPMQGIAVFRNRFQDENDIVAVYNTSATRVKGHSGPDVNTFRIIGLGAPLVVGAGRTGLVAGQTNLFPGPVTPEDKGNNSAGKFLSFESKEDGSGHACGKGSSTGVEEHIRCFLVDYSGKSGTEAVFVVADSSKNGRIWRLNTPEFNSITTDKEGFTITTPDGASLRGHVLQVKKPLNINTGKVRYGGETVRHNGGINYKGKKYKDNKWIDIENTGEITVVFTLQPKGKKHPTIRRSSSQKEIIIGEQKIELQH